MTGDRDISDEQESLQSRGIAKPRSLCCEAGDRGTIGGGCGIGVASLGAMCWRRVTQSPLAVGCLVTVILMAAANLSSTLLATTLIEAGDGAASRDVVAAAASPPPPGTAAHPAPRSGPRALPASVVDAVAFIVIGDLASGPAPGVAVEALRRRGQWRGPVVMLTDRPRCLEHLNGGDGGGGGGEGGWGITVVSVTGLPPREEHGAAWLLAVKGLKTRLFDFVVPAVPAAVDWEFMLYLDVDVWVAQPLQPPPGEPPARSHGAAFLDAIAPLVRSTQRPPQPQDPGSAALGARQHQPVPWIVLFADCAAHAVGWCAGCEEWNTGVMVVPNHLRAPPSPPPTSDSTGTPSPSVGRSGGRPSPQGGSGTSSSSSNPLYHDVTSQCLRRWRAVMESGRFSTDQEALEAAVAEAPRIGSTEAPRGLHRRGGRRRTTMATRKSTAPSALVTNITSASTSTSISSSSSSTSLVRRRRRRRRRLGGVASSSSPPAESWWWWGSAPEEAEALPGLCDGVVTIPDPSMRHLLFMKDYLALPGISLGMTGGGGGDGGGWPTFCHVTAANRIETQDWAYVRLARWLHSSLGLRSRFDASSSYGAATGQC